MPTLWVHRKSRLVHRLFSRIGLREAVNRGNVGMIQGRQQPRLALEARDTIGIGDKGPGQDLERHVAPQLHIMGAIHLAHRARREKLANLVRPDARTRLQPATVAARHVERGD
jgi:hypothetical protein